MTKKEAVTILNKIRESLQSDSTQFNFNVNIIGMTGNGGNGGIGIQGVSNGGGIGVQSIVSSPEIQITQGMLDDRIANDITRISSLLDQLVNQIESDQSKSTLNQTLQTLRETWVPGVVTSVIGSLIMLLVNP